MTGSIAWLGIVGGPAAGGCVDPVAINPGPCAWTVEAGFAWDLYRRIVVEGALVALAAGLVGGGRPRPPPRPRARRTTCARRTPFPAKAGGSR